MHKDELQLLVKSLTKSEKRYFTIYANSHRSDSKLVKLFEFIESKSTYTDADIAEHLSVNQPHVTKNHLHELILRSMRIYHAAKTSDILISGILCDVDFLYGKGLYKQAYAAIRKAKKIAQTTDKQLQMLEILKWENKLKPMATEKKNVISVTDNYLKEVFEEEKELVNRYINLIEYKYNFYQFYQMVRLASPSPKDLQKLENIVSDTLYKDIKNARTYDSKFYFYSTHALYNFIKGNYVQTEDNYSKLVQFMQSRPEYIKEKEKDYLKVLNNLLISQYYLKKFAKCYETIEIIDNSLKLDYGVYFSELFLTQINKLAVYTDTGDIDRAIDLINKVEKNFGEYMEKIIQQNIYVYFMNASYAYFQKKNYSKALFYQNQIINGIEDKANVLLTDMQCLVRLINLLVHYELGNYDLLENLIKSTKRFLSNRGSLYNFEAVLLDFFKIQIAKVHSKKETLANFTELKLQMEKIAVSKDKKSTFDYFDFTTWAESKITGRDMVDIIREKVVQ